MTAITISREAASGGDDIAADVAEALGYRLVDKHFMGRVLDQYGLIEFHREYDSYLSFWDKLDAERSAQRRLMMGLLTQVIQVVAQSGDVVILGRSGFGALTGFADVLHVRIQAPLDFRAARRAETSGEAVEAVRNDLAAIAKVRADFVRRFYDLDWFDARNFDLVVDTWKVPTDLAAGLITDAARALAPSDPDDPASVMSAEVDPVVVAAVEQEWALRRSASA